MVSLVTLLHWNWQRYQHFLFLYVQNSFQTARITFWPTMCFWPYIVDFAQNYCIPLPNSGAWPYNPLVSLVTCLHWNWQMSTFLVFMRAKCFSERWNHFLTNNVFLTCFSEMNRNINISCFYACQMLFRVLESLFDQQCVFDLTLLIMLKTNVFHFQMVEYGPITLW